VPEIPPRRGHPENAPFLTAGVAPPPGVPPGGVTPRRGVQGRIPCPDKGWGARADTGLPPADEQIKGIVRIHRVTSN